MNQATLSENPRRVRWFSDGAASAVATKFDIHCYAEKASAIEARRAETATEIGGSVHESGGPEGICPNTVRNIHDQHRRE
jgi:hypothetical protein